jgi:hypothetical protein
MVILLFYVSCHSVKWQTNCVVLVYWYQKINVDWPNKVKAIYYNVIKKCVAYPQKDFLFTILYGDSGNHQKSIFNAAKVKKKKQRYIWELPDKVCKLNPKS